MQTSSLFFRINAVAIALLFSATFCGLTPSVAQARKDVHRTTTTHTSVHHGGPSHHATGPGHRGRGTERRAGGPGHPGNGPGHSVGGPGHRGPGGTGGPHGGPGGPGGPGYDDHYDHHDHVGTALAVGAVTGLVVGSIVAASAMPPSCSTVVVNGIDYRQCGSTWYRPQYSGSQVNYIVVNPPR